MNDCYIHIYKFDLMRDWLSKYVACSGAIFESVTLLRCHLIKQILFD